MTRILHLWRAFGLYLLPAAIIGWLCWTDPDKGGSTHDMLLGAATGYIAITLAHLARRFLMPYLKLDKAVKEAFESPTGAGLVFLGAMIFLSALLMVFAPRAHAGELETFVPAGAVKYGTVLKAEQSRLWPDHAAPQYLGALVEVESCVTLRAKHCWNPAAQLKTEREEGAGLGQITRAYGPSGAVRMDALAEVKKLDSSLAELSWSNVYARPDLQLRAIVVMNRDCERRLSKMVSNKIERLRMCDAAYNGGFGGMQAERRACGQRVGCDPQQWFAHVEGVCLKSREKWKGYARSACDINRDHVRDVTVTRAPKYIPLMAAT